MTIRQAFLQFADKRRQLRYKFYSIIPFLFTFANGICGLLSIIKSIEGSYKAAAYCIVAASCMDMLDGRVARWLKVTSLLGAELDSLCDAISFCLAPTILMHSYYMYDGGLFALSVLAGYLCAGLFRLARFNVAVSGSSAWFSGLATPAAAWLLASTVVHGEWLEQYLFFGHSFVVMMPIIIVLTVLMISTVPFPTGKQIKLRKQAKIVVFMFGMFIASMCYVYHIPAMFLISLVYVLFGLIRVLKF